MVGIQTCAVVDSPAQEVSRPDRRFIQQRRHAGIEMGRVD